MLQLLQISRDIFHAHHYFEIMIMVVTGPAGISHVIAVFLAASPLSFSMQLVKTTDISQCSQLLVFLRYVHADAIKGNSYFVSVPFGNYKDSQCFGNGNKCFCQTIL
jgi:hypothetical protein